jgi:hypothetical protein
LQERARRHGQSLEELVRDILRDAAKETTQPSGGLGSEITALFRGQGFREGEIQEFRGHPVQLAKFDE